MQTLRAWLLAAYNIANTAVATALAAETDAVISNGSYAGDTQTLTFTLSEGGPIDINLTDVATDAELRNAIDAIPAGGVTSASFANDTETLTLTLADATTVTVDLSVYSTGPRDNHGHHHRPGSGDRRRGLRRVLYHG